MRKVELRMNEQEKYEVIKELVDHNGNKNRASKKLGISRSSLSRYEKGSRTIDIYVLNNILEIFNISYDDFVQDKLKGNYKKEVLLERNKMLFTTFLTGSILTFLALMFEIIYAASIPIYDEVEQRYSTLTWYTDWENSELVIFKISMILFFIVFLVFIGLTIKTIIDHKNIPNKF